MGAGSPSAVHEGNPNGEGAMNTETKHTESGNSPPEEVRESEVRASRIHSLLKLRDKAEAEISAVLREHLDEVGETAWLAWCEREFGWKRRASYNHLNPEQLQKARDRDEERRAQSVHIAEPPTFPAEELGDPSVRPLPLDTRNDEERESAHRKEEERADRRNARFDELEAGVKAPASLIEKQRTAWASLNVTEAEVVEVARGVEMRQEGFRILRAARQRVLDVCPTQMASVQAMDGNLDDIGKVFRFLFETGGVGNGNLAAPTESF